MPTYKITYNMIANVQGQYVAPGISVQVTTLMPNPFNEAEKVRQAFIRIHGIDFKPEGYLTPSCFVVEEIS